MAMDEYSYAVGFDEGYESKEQECYQCELFPRVIPAIPLEYVGETKRNGGYTNTDPREWTKEEVEWVKSLKSRGYSVDDIAQSVGRSKTSVATKLKRIGKTVGKYNEDHVIEKYRVNAEYIKALKPKTVLDLYCGAKSFYCSNFQNIATTTNDKDNTVGADYHMDAFKLLCKLYAKNATYDVIDLDPFGSAFDCFDLAFKMARKGVVITFGEIGHKRWKRLDFVRTRYGINNIEEFNTEALIKVVQDIAARNKKRAVVFKKCEWLNISRVWFVLEPLKITEQWEGAE